MNYVVQGIIHGRIATISTHDLVKQQAKGPTVHGHLNIERLAFLRALASGIPKADAMDRYFPDIPNRDRKAEAEATIAVARALARRLGDSAAHLIGTDIWALTKTKGPKPGLETIYDRDAFLEHLREVDPYVASHLEDCTEEDIHAEYLDRFGHNDAVGSIAFDDEDSRRGSRRNRLVDLHVDAIRRLEKITVETPTIWDKVRDWMPAHWTPPLAAAGIETLDDLGRRIRVGGCWYADIPDLKPGIAVKVKNYLERLLPGHYKPATPVTMDVVAKLTAEAPHVLKPIAQTTQTKPTPYPALHPSTLEDLCFGDPRQEQSPDQKAIDRWARAVVNSPTTARSYAKESRRFIAWLATERGGKQLAHIDSDDCLAYLTFLQNIPEPRISRRRLTTKEAGGLIFRGQLSDASVAQARVIVSSMCEWLFATGYMTKNPWRGLHKKVARVGVTNARRSKALSDDWMKKALGHLANQPPNPVKARMVFLLEFTTRTGLRPAELVNARIGHFVRTDEGLFLSVVGKGNRERWCVINPAAEDALRQYLRERGLPTLEGCEKDTPLISSTLDSSKPVGYQALHESFRVWMKNLTLAIGEQPITANKPTLHKLRHTFATLAVKDGVPYDVIQAQLGHQDINTTISTYATAPDARRAAEMNRLS